MENDFFFRPYVGELYGKPNNFFNGKKVLVIGNSHHCDEEYDVKNRCGSKCCNYSKDCHEFTEGVIKWYLQNPKGTGLEPKQKSWRPTYTRFANVFKDGCDVNMFYNSVIFYNFLQRAVSNSKAKGSTSEIANSRDLFRRLIEFSKPDYIIVWGVTNVLNNLPKDDTWQCIDKEGRVYKFKMDEKDYIVIAPDHPVSFHQTNEQRRELIKSFAPELLQ